jgi:REP element-mobilizing transposase RayT
MDWFKTMTTNEYIRGVKEQDWQPFYRKLWQRNYWEHIVRNEKELERIRTYVINNPTNWDTDNENPKNIPARKC